MATHSSILAWKTPWTEEPGGLQSVGSQRVGHDWATNHTLCLYGLACSGHSMKGNHIICGLLWLTFLSLFSGFRYVVVRIRTIIFFLYLNYIPLYEGTSFCLSAHQLTDIWVVSMFWLLGIMLLWMSLYKFLCWYIFSILLHLYGGHVVILFNLE